jgi:hypothetical protein
MRKRLIYQNGSSQIYRLGRSSSKCLAFKSGLRKRLGCRCAPVIMKEIERNLHLAASGGLLLSPRGLWQSLVCLLDDRASLDSKLADSKWAWS